MEIVCFLRENSTNMIFIDDLNLNELYDEKKLEIILVDHYTTRSKFDENVIEIIDHHHVEPDLIKLKEYNL
jgi:inorganic pyrophosphatase/exopolyphosphatase